MGHTSVINPASQKAVWSGLAMICLVKLDPTGVVQIPPPATPGDDLDHLSGGNGFITLSLDIIPRRMEQLQSVIQRVNPLFRDDVEGESPPSTTLTDVQSWLFFAL